MQFFHPGGAGHAGMKAGEEYTAKQAQGLKMLQPDLRMSSFTDANGDDTADEDNIHTGRFDGEVEREKQTCQYGRHISDAGR